MRPFLIRRGGRLCVCTTPKKRISSLNTKTTTTKGRQTSPKRPFFFCLLHSFAVRLQRIGMQRETTTRPIFKSKGGYLLKIGKYHAFRKMPRANRAACVWFKRKPPPFKKPPRPIERIRPKRNGAPPACLVSGGLKFSPFFPLLARPTPTIRRAVR